jgi:hypothetical protein
MDSIAQEKIDEIENVKNTIRFWLTELKSDLVESNYVTSSVLRRTIGSVDRADVLFDEKRYLPAAWILADCLLTMLCFGWIDSSTYKAKRENLLFFAYKQKVSRKSEPLPAFKDFESSRW